jgi:hypothetical protein
MRYSLFWIISAAYLVSLPTFRDSLSVPSSRLKHWKKDSLNRWKRLYTADGVDGGDLLSGEGSERVTLELEGGDVGAGCQR